jgi:hypothetical protein
MGFTIEHILRLKYLGTSAPANEPPLDLREVGDTELQGTGGRDPARVCVDRKEDGTQYRSL